MAESAPSREDQYLRKRQPGCPEPDYLYWKQWACNSPASLFITAYSFQPVASFRGGLEAVIGDVSICGHGMSRLVIVGKSL